MLLLSGSILCMALHYAIAGTMATYGHYADSVNGNENLRWVIAGSPGKAVIACSYIFTGIYGLTWVCPSFNIQSLSTQMQNTDSTGSHGMGLFL